MKFLMKFIFQPNGWNKFNLTPPHTLTQCHAVLCPVRDTHVLTCSTRHHECGVEREVLSPGTGRDTAHYPRRQRRLIMTHPSKGGSEPQQGALSPGWTEAQGTAMLRVLSAPVQNHLWSLEPQSNSMLVYLGFKVSLPHARAQ